MSSSSLTATYEALPKVLKIVIQAILGALVGGVYRIIRYTETKNLVSLVVGILNFVGLGFVFWVIDLVTEVLYDRITVLAD